MGKELITSIRRDMVGKVLVSTVRLMDDRGFDGEGSRWETMVFEGEYNGFQARYASEAEAIVGHDEILAKVTACS